VFRALFGVLIGVSGLLAGVLMVLSMLLCVMFNVGMRGD